MVDRTFRKRYVPVILFSICATSALCKAEPLVDRRVAEKIAIKKGVLKPSEVWQWKMSDKNIPKDWVKIDNKYFSVSYPKCFSIEGEEGEEDTKISPMIRFSRGENCRFFKKDFGVSNSFSIGFFPRAGITSIDRAFSADYSLVKQKININEIDAISLGGLKDHYDRSEDRYDSQLRWQLFLICKKRTYRMISTVPPGKPTMDLVEKNNYAWPEDFKMIISTFQCK